MPLQELQIDINSVISDPSVPKLYANTFTGSISLTDATLVGSMGGNPIAVISMSHDTFFLLKKLVDLTFEHLQKAKGDKFADPSLLVKKFEELQAQQLKTTTTKK